MENQNVWPNKMLFLTQMGKRARTNKGILPVLLKGRKKIQFKAPEAQRLCEKHARKTVNRPAAGMYGEPGREGSWELSSYFATASREQDMGHSTADRHSTGHSTAHSTANSRQTAQADTYWGRIKAV